MIAYLRHEHQKIFAHRNIDLNIGPAEGWRLAVGFPRADVEVFRGLGQSPGSKALYAFFGAEAQERSTLPAPLRRMGY